MQLLLTLAKNCTIGSANCNWHLDSYKVLDSDYDIVLFFTVDSIKREFNIEVEPQGSIKGQPVIDVQALVDVLESNQHTAFDILANYLEIPSSTKLVDYKTVQHLMHKLPSHLLRQVVASTSLDIAENLYLEKYIAEALIKKYGNSSSKRKACSTKGFAVSL